MIFRIGGSQVAEIEIRCYVIMHRADTENGPRAIIGIGPMANMADDIAALELKKKPCVDRRDGERRQHQLN